MPEIEEHDKIAWQILWQLESCWTYLKDFFLLNCFAKKELILGDSSPTAEASANSHNHRDYICFLFQPLHLDFCHQVTKFVRDCVLSSPVESLRSLSKVLFCSENNSWPSNQNP